MDIQETSPAQELEAMTSVASALSGLDNDATGRVLRWAAERFGNVALPQRDGAATNGADSADGAVAAPQQNFDSFAELHAIAAPDTDAEQALVAAYWVQYVEGSTEFGSQRINAALRDLGRKVSNITNAFAALISQKPQLAVQLRKSGSSKQARKTYKLTTAGKAAVEAMLHRAE